MSDLLLALDHSSSASRVSVTRSGHKRASPSDSQPADKMYVVDHMRYIFETTNGQIVCIVRAMYGKGYSTAYCMTEVVVLPLRPLAETRDRFLPSRAFCWGKMAAGGERIWCPRESAT